MGRPLLKGIFHLLASIIYIILLPHLYELIPAELKLSLTIYLLVIIGNFGASALFHLIKWPKHIIWPRRLDHIMIFIKIAISYYIIITTIFININILVIYLLIIGIMTGIILRIFHTKASKMMIAIPYIIMGWSIIFDIPVLINYIFIEPIGALILISGGLCYTIGAIVYMTKSPKLCPTYMGYHELLHVCSIIGTTLFTIFIFNYSIPHYLQYNNQ